MKKMYKVLLVLFTLLVLAFSLTACISFGGHEEANNCLHPDFEETVVEATCYADGEVCKVCKVCGYTSRSVLPAVHHQYGESVRVEGNCQNYGYYEFPCVNEGCTEKIIEYDNVYGDHDYELGVCTLCGAVDNDYNTDTEDNPTDDDPTEDEPTTDEPTTDEPTADNPEHVHTPGGVFITDQYFATCTEKGSYDEVVYCTECDEELSRETFYTDKLPHNEGEILIENEYASTCSSEGQYEEVIYCTECDEELSRVLKTTEKIPHGDGYTLEENFIEVGCENDGTYDLVEYCSVCDEEISRETVIVENAHHFYEFTEIEDAKEPTCYEEGFCIEVTYCSVCEQETGREEIILPIEHDFIDGVCWICSFEDPSQMPPVVELEFILSDDGTYYTVAGMGAYNGVNLIIPDEYEGIPVKVIAQNAFADCTEIKNIVIPESITDIGAGAFSGCTSVEYIGYFATELNPLPVVNSSNWVFARAGYDKDGIKVVIGANVKQIPERLFANGPDVSPHITSLIFEEGSVCEKIGNSAFDGHREITELVLPDSLISIGDCAFRGIGVKHFVIPENVTHIGSLAFFAAELESLTFGANTKQFGKGYGGAEQIFEGCNNLKSVYFTGTLEEWFDIDFYGSFSNPLCNGAELYIDGELVEELIIPEGVTEIKRCAFSGCTSVKSLAMHRNVVKINTGSFKNCVNLSSIELADTSGWYIEGASSFLDFSNPEEALTMLKEQSNYTYMHNPSDPSEEY